MSNGQPDKSKRPAWLDGHPERFMLHLSVGIFFFFIIFLQVLLISQFKVNAPSWLDYILSFLFVLAVIDYCFVAKHFRDDAKTAQRTEQYIWHCGWIKDYLLVIMFFIVIAAFCGVMYGSGISHNILRMTVYVIVSILVATLPLVTLVVLHLSKNIHTQDEHTTEKNEETDINLKNGKALERIKEFLNINDDRIIKHFIKWGVSNYIDWEDESAEKKRENFRLGVHCEENNYHQISHFELQDFKKQLEQVFKEREDSLTGKVNNIYRKWQHIKKYVKQHPVISTVIYIVVAFLILAFIGGYMWGWGRWVGTTLEKITITGNNSNSPNSKLIDSKSIDVKGGSLKTLWDWLDLLIVPVILTIGGTWFARAYTARTEKIDQDGRLERQRTIALKTYFDEMSQFILSPKQKKNMGNLCNIANARTWVVLRQLDRIRKGDVIRFLHGANLIKLPENRSGQLSKSSLPEEKTIIDLRGAQLQEIALRWANLKYANLQKAWMMNAELSEAQLDMANLDEAILTQAIISNADLANASLSGTILIGANLRSTRLSEAKLSKACLYRADLSYANFSEANLSEANLSEANLSEANLSYANLSNAIVTVEQLKQAKSFKGIIWNNADLRGADLSSVDLSEANLSEANLSEANLTGANLTGANLTGANLSEADLTGANLSKVKLERVTLKRAKYNTQPIRKKDKQGNPVFIRPTQPTNFCNQAKSAGMKEIRDSQVFICPIWVSWLKNILG